MIAERLAASDPANAAWQRHLSVPHFKLYQVAAQAGDAARAEAELRACYGVLDGMKRRGLPFDPQMAQVYDPLRAPFGG